MLLNLITLALTPNNIQALEKYIFGIHFCVKHKKLPFPSTWPLTGLGRGFFWRLLTPIDCPRYFRSNINATKYTGVKTFEHFEVQYENKVLKKAGCISTRLDSNILVSVLLHSRHYC